MNEELQDAIARTLLPVLVDPLGVHLVTTVPTLLINEAGIVAATLDTHWTVCGFPVEPFTTDTQTFTYGPATFITCNGCQKYDWIATYIGVQNEYGEGL